MLFGKDYDTSIYLMLKGNKKVSNKIKHMISMMPEEFLTEVRAALEKAKTIERDKYGIFKETLEGDVKGYNGICFNYAISEAGLEILCYDSKVTDRCNELYSLNIDSVDDLSDKYFGVTHIIGQFSSTVSAEKYSIVEQECEYELANTPLGCALIEKREINPFKERFTTSFYPINFKKLLEARSQIDEEENNMRLRKNK